ncbi:protein ITPRID2 [Denticeps clupeoides]|uniref:ITPR-interacting domain-containing protein n=1 Tax=Denticeps clupeoides TaxID=299321 RepID=A0AAY4EUY1_9TELE|nr:protein TESPA1 [Denticeps clupeoides]
MESPSSVVRRQAWADGSRRWVTLEEQEPQGPCPAPPDLRPRPEDDVRLLGGCATGKIETWLQGCGSVVGLENPSHLTLESLLKTYGSCEDDLSLGAEATALNAVDGTKMGYPVLQPPPKSRQKGFTTSTPQRLGLPLYNMGHSMASSCLSITTTKTASSLSEVLQMCSEDAEETLLQLGFGCDEPQVTARIPSRFFNFPSQLRGINFKLFLESQLTRIRQEDPNLSLASRFRQVEVLTAMANAFYSLYSHVSRTPLQKLAPPDFSFASPTPESRIAPRFFDSIRCEPKSPVERLKDTVSKMCLYTGSRSSDYTSPQNSPRKRRSLPDVVEVLMENGTTGAACSPRRQRSAGEDVEGAKAEVQTPLLDNHGGMNRTQDFRTLQAGHSRTKLRQLRRSRSVSDSGQTLSPISDTSAAEDAEPQSRVPKISHEVICPQVVESVHRAPQYCAEDKTAKDSSEQRPGCTTPFHTRCCEDAELTHNPECTGTVTNRSQGLQDTSLGDLSLPLAPSSPTGLMSPCQIMVTGWEGDLSSAHKDPVGDGSFARCRPSEAEEPGGSELLSYQKFLSPISHRTHKPKQANSFELEEVHSAGEEEMGPPQSRMHMKLSLFSPNKGQAVRGDSFQSDSSGYIEEDLNLTPSPMSEKTGDK